MSDATNHHRHRCWIEVDPDALRDNAKTLRARGGMDLLAVVKANAYGHGAAAVVRALQGSAALFGVANLHEAEEVETTNTTTPIILLGTCLPEEREAALLDGLHVCISSLKEAAEWDGLAAKLDMTLHGHIAIDTGMGRMGFPEEMWNETTARDLLKFPHIHWEGLASHLPSADEDVAFTTAQIDRFRKVVAIAHAAELRPHWIHLDNSAGMLGYPQIAEFCNLARPGLALYGVSPLPEHANLLKPALTWKTRVLLVRDLPAGHGVSYGRADKLKRNSRVATLACGYADGYPRQVSGKGATVLIHGQHCPLLGRVTMDMIMVDVTDVAPSVAVGDEAVLLGAQGGATISASEIAAKADTIPWHVLTSISARVERALI
ncbi:MAG: alanine racemase [Verrucomicrobia bacterium]|nr:alanine racemase [Verrucomicrobiota bacterium]